MCWAKGFVDGWGELCSWGKVCVLEGWLKVVVAFVTGIMCVLEGWLKVGVGFVAAGRCVCTRGFVVGWCGHCG